MICRNKKYFAITGEIFIKYEESESKVAQSCPTLCDPMDCSAPGSSFHGFSRQEYWSGARSYKSQGPLSTWDFMQ